MPLAWPRSIFTGHRASEGLLVRWVAAGACLFDLFGYLWGRKIKDLRARAAAITRDSGDRRVQPANVVRVAVRAVGHGAHVNLVQNEDRRQQARATGTRSAM